MLKNSKMSDKVKIIIKTMSNEHKLGIRKGQEREFWGNYHRVRVLIPTFVGC